MRSTGTKAYGIRTPIITKGDDLEKIVVDSLLSACENENIELNDMDVLGITEAVVAKAQSNFAELSAIAEDVKNKFGDEPVGVVFPILSRNRFFNILKGIAMGAKKVFVLLSCPSDEVGNPIISLETYDEIESRFTQGPIKGEEFRTLSNNFLHPFTDVDYIDLYQSISDNIEVYVSNTPKHILALTKNIIVGEIHTRDYTKKRLEILGAEKIYTLSDILSTSVCGSGYNPEYGVLGSNIATGQSLKLFPRDCMTFVTNVQQRLYDKTGKKLEVLVYGDGAFKDPEAGIWELADPVVSPGYTGHLSGQPSEIKLKYVADNVFGELTGEIKNKAVTHMIKTKALSKKTYNEGTTPRKYVDLLGSLCDLMSGSGDKGTPIILIQGYFDNYASE